MIELTWQEFDSLYNTETLHIVNDETKGDGIVFDEDTLTTSIHNVKLLTSWTHYTPFYNLVTADFTGLDVSSVTALAELFGSDLESIDVSNWDVSNVTNFQELFGSCYKLTSLDLSSWNVSSNATDISGMFMNCTGLTSLDLSGWDVSNVTDFNSLFRYCSNLTTLNLSGWDTSSAETSAYMFEGTSSLQNIIVGPNTNLSGIASEIPETIVVYNESDERLIVKGNERITRDLKVQGKVIVAGTISSNGSLVLTDADKTNTVTEDSTDVITSGAVYTALEDKIDVTEKGASNGVATLDATGRVPYSQLPESAMEYKGTWDASTNTPELKDGTGTNGDFYVVEVAGTVNFGTTAEPRNVTFYVNDRAIYDGTTQEWARLPAGEVRSVNGMSGDVTLTASNVDYDANTTVKQAIDAKQTTLTFDNAPTTGSSNPVTSDGIKTYVDTQIDTAITQVLNTGF